MNQLREASLRGRNLKATLPPPHPARSPVVCRVHARKLKQKAVVGPCPGRQREPTGWHPPLQTARVAELSGTWPAMTQLLRPGAGLMRCGEGAARLEGRLCLVLKGCLWLGLVAHIRWGLWRGGKKDARRRSWTA